MVAPTITAFWAGLIGLLGVWLAVNVVRKRVKLGVQLGDGGNEEMNRAVRVFGNFAEYTALALVLIALLEMTGGWRWLIHACGAVLLAARLGHAWGLSSSGGTTPGRLVGTAVTWTVIVVAGVMLVWNGRGAFA